MHTACGGARSLLLATPALHRRVHRHTLQACCAEADDGTRSDQASTAAAKLCDAFVKDGTLVAVDAGKLCSAAVQEVGRRLDERSLRDVQVIATCEAAASEAAFVGVPQAMSADHAKIDVMFAEVDAVDITSSGLTFVHGRRAEPAQPNIPRFRAAARKAAQFVAILHSDAQACSRLAGSLPVIIENENWEEIAEEVDDIVLGDAEIWRRPSEAKPDISPNGGDNPYVSPEGYAILDIRYGQRKQPNGPQSEGEFCLFGDHSVDYNKIDAEIMAVPGTVMTGLLSDVASHVAICGEEVTIIDKASLTAATAQSMAEDE